jgi:hypothetical protein
VTAGTTLHCQPDAPEGKVEVIMDDDHLVGGNLEIPQHLAYSLTAAVHVSEGHQENYFPSADRGSSPAAGKFALFQVHRKASSQPLEDSKAHIVPGSSIVSTRVSQSNNGNYLVHQFPLLAYRWSLCCALYGPRLSQWPLVLFLSRGFRSFGHLFWNHHGDHGRTFVIHQLEGHPTDQIGNVNR